MIIGGVTLFRADFSSLFQKRKHQDQKASSSETPSGHASRTDGLSEDKIRSDAFFWVMYPIY
jgi:hypothetical protein